MKTILAKASLLMLTASTSMAGQLSAQALSAALQTGVPGEATLVSRYNGGDYHTAGYSFKYRSQDVNLTRNNYEILFEAREDFAQDRFETVTVTDDDSAIYDLGEKDNCRGLGDERVMFSMSRQRSADVKVNHCYLADNKDGEGHIVTRFHVKRAVKSFTVTIDQMEVLYLRENL